MEPAALGPRDTPFGTRQVLVITSLPDKYFPLLQLIVVYFSVIVPHELHVTLRRSTTGSGLQGLKTGVKLTN